MPLALRRALVIAAAAVCLVLAGGIVQRLFTGALDAPFDFTEYWCAGRLNATGENPYDGSNMRALQRSLGLDDTAIMMWNPPWTLTIVMPIGLLEFRTAYGVWVLANLALIVLSAELLWRGLGGDVKRRGIAWLLTLTFVPTMFLIGSGQITGLVLIGLAGFAVLREKRPFVAGMVGALTAVKPHLLGLFALWLLLNAVRDRGGRRVLAGGLLVGLLACIPPTLANPDVWSQYLAATTGSSSADHHSLTRWTPPLVGWWLRTAVPGQPFWVQWLPFALAAAGFTFWFFSPRRTGRVSLPAIVGLSLLFAPYGVWQHDLVLLLVPVLTTAAKLRERSAIVAGIAWLALANAAMLVMMLNHTSSEWYVWVTPVVLAGCAATLRLQESPRPAEAAA
jgi:hypothetical protein